MTEHRGKCFTARGTDRVIGRVGATRRKGFAPGGLHPPYEWLTRGRAQYSE